MRTVHEVMETFLDCNHFSGEPERDPSLPREWVLWCRVIKFYKDGRRRVADTYLHTISQPNLDAARATLRKFIQGKVLVKEEW